MKAHSAEKGRDYILKAIYSTDVFPNAKCYQDAKFTYCLREVTLSSIS